MIRGRRRSGLTGLLQSGGGRLWCRPREWGAGGLAIDLAAVMLQSIALLWNRVSCPVGRPARDEYFRKWTRWGLQARRPACGPARWHGAGRARVRLASAHQGRRATEVQPQAFGRALDVRAAAHRSTVHDREADRLLGHRPG